MRAPYTRNATGTSVSAASRKPLVRDIDFVAGDEVHYKFLFTGKVWTHSRPEGPDGQPMYHESETVPEGVEPSTTALVAPWERRYWFSQVRDSYVSSVRYYNGWIPWYGMRPDWAWWRSATLAATFSCTPYYSVSAGGTVVEVALADSISKNIKPHKKYRWDLESTRVKTEDGDGIPTDFEGTRTWVGGRCTVYPEWTI